MQASWHEQKIAGRKLLVVTNVVGGRSGVSAAALLETTLCDVSEPHSQLQELASRFPWVLFLSKPCRLAGMSKRSRVESFSWGRETFRERDLLGVLADLARKGWYTVNLGCKYVTSHLYQLKGHVFGITNAPKMNV